jgi:hypothetical protein
MFNCGPGPAALLGKWDVPDVIWYFAVRIVTLWIAYPPMSNLASIPKSRRIELKLAGLDEKKHVFECISQAAMM